MRTSGVGSAAAAALAALAPRHDAHDDHCDIDILTTSYEAPAVHPGWRAQLVMNNLSTPRALNVDSEGALLILDRGVGVRHVTFNDHGHTCLEVDTDELIIDNEDLNHGMALSLDGRTLYASDTENVYAWAYDASAGSVSGNGTIVITNMTSNAHVTRTLLMSEHSPGYLVVSRGSSENVAAEAMHLDSGLSQIRAFNINDTDTYPIDYLDGLVLGWGLRNAVGLAEDPDTGAIYSVETSVTDVVRNGEDIKEDNPAEELNYHGTIEEAGDDSPRNYGYPECYAVWNPDDIPDHEGLQVGDQFAADTNDTLDDQTCRDEYHPPRLSFPAHYAPLDAIFNANGSELFIAFHGSFNREDPHGYMLSTVAFSDGDPVEPRNSTDSLTSIMAMTDLSNCPDNCFRPMGMAWDPQGRLFLTSDSTGELFILEHLGGDDQDSSDSPSSTESGTLVQPSQTGSSGTQDDEEDDDSVAAGISAVHSLGVAVAAFVTAMLMSF